MTGCYNVGTGVETSVNTLYDAIRRAAGVDLEPRRGQGKRGEQQRSSLDATALERATGFRPKTTLTDGIRETVEYFRTRATGG